MKVLVVGGAGYIGSHMVQMLGERGHDVVVLDNLSSGYREAVLGGEFVQADLADAAALDALFQRRRFDAVMHFASFIQVGESVREPAKYYRNNYVYTLDLLEAMVRHQVSSFIFSSTAAIFGEPDYVPIDEKHPRRPINPYGFSKFAVEQALLDFEPAYGLRSTCLRYFNAAGADPEGRIGERHEPETHLIPLVLQAASGRRGHIDVYGEPNPRRAQVLLEHARRMFPDLDTGTMTEWMGERPSTPDYLPVIGRSSRYRNVFYAFGHGHVGVVSAAPTGRLIAELVAGRAPSVAIDPYRVDRF